MTEQDPDATLKDDLELRLKAYGQQHVLGFWERLSGDERRQLARELEDIDLELIAQLASGDSEQPDWSARAAEAVGPPAIRLGEVPTEWSLDEARQAGDEALAQGQVGIILVAGGQGTRLGSSQPKGLYPIGPVSRRTLFEMHFDRIRAVSQRYGRPLDTFLMTSPATDEATREFLEQRQWCGLSEETVHVFCQGTMPAVDDQGKLLLETPGHLALSPDGHGGLLAALDRYGFLDDFSRRGIEQLFYFQIDNPLVEIGDPVFIGHHLLARSELTTQVVAKREPLEKVGNVAQVRGQVMVIEYSDLPESAAHRRHADGSLVLWAGNTAIHMFDARFLRRVRGEASSLPFHFARKKVPYIDLATGNRVEPSAPNATKFERFVFDLLPAAQRALVVEVDEKQAFAPLKNASGTAERDTPEYVERMLMERDRRLLRAAGIEVAHGVKVEINPCYALDEAELARRAATLGAITRDTYFRADR